MASTVRITLEFTNLPDGTATEDYLARRAVEFGNDESRYLSTFPDHPNLANHSMVGVEVTITRVLNPSVPS